MKHWNQNRIVAVIVGASAVAVMWLGFSADASSAFAKYVGRCAEVGFYDRHARWCEAAYTIVHHRVPRRARAEPAGELSAVPAYGPNVTVYRDRQAPSDVSGPADRYIALQTADDVQRGPAFGLFLGWLPGLLDMGPKYVPVPSRAQVDPPPRRIVVRTVTTRVVDCVRVAHPQCGDNNVHY